MEQHATEPPTDHGELLGCVGDLLHRGLELGPGARPDANGHHLPNPGAELVAEGGPRNSRIGIGVGLRLRLRLAAVKLSGKHGRDRRGSRRIKTVPESAHERDALLGGEGFEGW